MAVRTRARGRLLRALVAGTVVALVASILAAGAASAADGTLQGVVRDSSGTGIAGVCVYVRTSDGRGYVTGFTTGASGGYSGPVAPGTYLVEFRDCSNSGYVAEWYDDQPSAETATPVVIADSGTATADAVLATGGSISGIVTGHDGLPLADACLNARQSENDYSNAAYGRTASDGTYTLSGLRAGDWRVRANDCGGGDNVARWHPSGRTWAEAEAVAVSAGASVGSIDIQLPLGGRIAGTVTDETGKPIEGACVTASGPTGGNGTSTAADGTYIIRALEPGSLSVRFDGCGEGYVGEYYDDVRDHLSATAVAVVAGESTTGIDAALARAGSISGTVTDDGGSPIGSLCVGAQGVDGSIRQMATTAADGTYSIAGLATGAYRVQFAVCGEPFVSEWFRDAAASDAAGIVEVEAPYDTGAIDATLSTGGWIEGRVTDADTGEPLGDICVSAFSTDGGGSWRSATTSGTGSYRILGLATDEYGVGFSNCGEDMYVTQYHAPIAVTDGSGVSNVDAALVLGTTISGTVTGDSGEPLDRVCINANAEVGSGYSYADTSSDGTYTLTGVPDGDIIVSFADCGGRGYARQWWNARSSSSSADAVAVVNREPVTGIDAELVPGGSITGTVTTVGGAPATDACVDASEAGSDEWTASSRVSSAGTYTIAGLPTGSYLIAFSECETDTIYSWYDGASDAATADPVSVTAGATSSGIDAVVPDGAGGPSGGHNPDVTLTASPASGSAPLALDLAVGATDPDGGTLSYVLLFGDGSDAVAGDVVEPYAAAIHPHTYELPGQYAAVATVFDPQGNATPGGTVVHVGNDPPTASLSVSPSSGAAPLLVSADIGGSDPNGQALSYRLDFGDGTGFVYGALPSGPVAHEYQETGSYTVSLYVDDGEATTVTTATVHVTDRLATSTALEVTPASSVHGERVTLAATVSDDGGSPVSGDVAFAVDGVDVATVALDAAGNASTSVALDAGARQFTARYLGTPDYGPSEATVSRTVAKAATAVTLTSSANPIDEGDAVTFDASVAVVAPGSGDPTGTLSFFDGATLLDTVTLATDGTASLTVPDLSAGTHSITAAYSGDAHFEGDVSDVHSQHVRTATSTALSADPSGSVFGQAVTLTASVTDVDGAISSGEVEFSADGASLGTAALDSTGTATLVVSSLSVGDHDVRATFLGTDVEAPSSAVIAYHVAPAQTSTDVASTPAVSDPGEAVTLDVTVAPVAPGAGRPAGEVEIYGGATLLATLTLADGRAGTTVSDLAPGSHDLRAVYLGSTSFESSESEVHAHQVRHPTETTLAVEPTASRYGQTVTLRATVAVPGVSTVPTGKVRFSDGSTVLAEVTLQDGVAELTPSDLDVGVHELSAEFLRTDAFVGSSDALSHTVSKANVTVTLTAESTVATGQSATLTATVTPEADGTPTGDVEFREGDTLLGTATLEPSTSHPTATLDIVLPGGSHSVTAVYLGDGRFLGASSDPPTEISVELPAIRGTVTDESGNPLSGMCVELRDAGRQTTTAADGGYELADVDPGSYYVDVDDCTGTNYVAASYTGGTSSAAQVQVGETTSAEGIDVVLALGGQISGRIVDQTGAPIEGACASARDGYRELPDAVTGADGRYVIHGVPAQQWRVLFDDCGRGTYSAEWYEHTLRGSEATWLDVTPGGSVTGIDGTLVELGRVSGTVVDPEGNPLAGICIGVSNTFNGSYVETDATGSYVAPSVLPGEQLAVAGDCTNGAWLTAPHGADASNPGGTTFQVVAGETTTGIDFVLQPRPTITGTVVDVAGAPVDNVCVTAFDASGRSLQERQTGVDGSYELRPDSTADARVRFYDCTPAKRGTQWFDGVYAPGAATVLDLAVGSVATGVDGVLGVLGTVEGTVTDENGNPIEGICVTIHKSADEIVANGRTGADGTYSVTTPPGSALRAQFVDCAELGFDAIWGRDGTSFDTADAFTVAGDTVVSGVDVTMTANAPPEASLAVADVCGAAPFTTTADVSGTDVLGDPLVFTLAWGDGQQTQPSSLPTDTLQHTYVGPGTYVVIARVDNGRGQVTSVEETVIVTGDGPMVAEAGDDRYVVTGSQVRFDASGSQLHCDTRVAWDFGDGTTGDGIRASHTYGEAGTFLATVTLTAGDSVVEDSVVVVVGDATGAGLEVSVTGEDGGPVPDADVLVVDPDGAQHLDVTGTDGIALLSGLADGDHTVYAIADGYGPTTATATVEAGTGTVSIVLEAGTLATGEIKSARMTYDQILAAGIDPDDPNNQHIEFVEINIAVVPPGAASGGGGGGGGGGGWGGGGDYPGYVSFTICGYWNGYEMLPSTLVPSGFSQDCLLPEPGVGWEHDGIRLYPGPATGNPETVQFLRIPAKATFLKEFFDVTLVVTNLAGPGFDLENGVASIDIPEGISMAPTAAPQSSKQPVPTIPGGSSHSVRWVLRGDVEGYYDLTARYLGYLQPFKKLVSVTAETAEPVHVWGASAMELRVDVDEDVNQGYPYHLRLGLENVADTPVYNATIEMLDEGRENFIYQPEQRQSFGVDVVMPGETFWTDEVILVPEISGEVDLSQSFVRKTAGTAELDWEITTHPTVNPPSTAPKLETTSLYRSVGLVWDQVPGATAYRIFATPGPDIPFDASPVLEVPADVLKTRVPGDPNARMNYAISSVVDGVGTMEHPLVPGQASSVPVEPRVDVRLSSNGCDGEDVFVEVTFESEFAELTAWSWWLGDGAPVAGTLSGNSQTVTFTVLASQIPEGGIPLNIRGEDEAGVGPTYTRTVGCVPTRIGTVLDVANPSIVITGAGFGSVEPAEAHLDTTSDHLRVTDETKGWSAGATGDQCTAIIGHWSDEAIIVSPQVNRGFGNECNADVGDSLRVDIWPSGDRSEEPISVRTVMTQATLEPKIDAVSPPFGPRSGGTMGEADGTVWLSGQSLDDVEAVWFGDLYAELPRSNGASIGVVPPPKPSADMVRMRVVTSRGKSDPGICAPVTGCASAYYYMEKNFDWQPDFYAPLTSATFGASLGAKGGPCSGKGKLAGGFSFSVDMDSDIAVWVSDGAYLEVGDVSIDALHMELNASASGEIECDIPIVVPAGLYAHVATSVAVKGAFLSTNVHDLELQDSAIGWLNGGVYSDASRVFCEGSLGSVDNCIETDAFGGGISGDVEFGLKLGAVTGPAELSVATLFGMGANLTSGERGLCWAPLQPKFAVEAGSGPWKLSFDADTIVPGIVQLAGDEGACPFGEATSSAGGVSAERSGGSGSVAVAAIDSSQVDPPAPGATDSYFAVSSDSNQPAVAAAGASVRSMTTAEEAPAAATASPEVTIVTCDLNGGRSIYWWTGTAWQAISAELSSPAEGCLGFTLDDTTSPSIADLADTLLFGVSSLAVGGDTGGGGGGTGGGGGGGTGGDGSDGGGSDGGAGPETTVLAGADRMQTAILASQEAFPEADSAPAVVLARADAFPDALAGVPLAAKRGAPLLLSTSEQLRGDVLAEIERVLPAGGEVLVLGGTAALSNAVEITIVDAGYEVKRFAGVDRYETAVAIARDGIGDPKALLVVSGLTFADALSAGPAAARVDGAIVLSAGSSMPSATANYLARVDAVDQYAVGGPAAQAAPTAVSLAGNDRYATAVAVAERFFPAPTTMGVATGLSFPDGMSGGALLAGRGAPLLLVQPQAVPESVVDYMTALESEVSTLLVLGGEAAVSPAVIGAIEDVLKAA